MWKGSVFPVCLSLPRGWWELESLVGNTERLCELPVWSCRPCDRVVIDWNNKHVFYHHIPVKLTWTSRLRRSKNQPRNRQRAPGQVNELHSCITSHTVMSQSGHFLHCSRFSVIIYELFTTYEGVDDRVYVCMTFNHVLISTRNISFVHVIMLMWACLSNVDFL